MKNSDEASQKTFLIQAVYKKMGCFDKTTVINLYYMNLGLNYTPKVHMDVTFRMHITQ